MEVRFWGVRGSVAVSGSRFFQTGGNTSCVEIVHQGERLILDGGTGLQALGQTIHIPGRAALVFSHVHWDHIQGVPFFGPAFHPDMELVMMGATREGVSLQAALAAQMRPPTFPITLDTLRAQISYRELAHNQPTEWGPFRIHPMDGIHPNGVLCLRIEAGGKSLIYATDMEHTGVIDPTLVRLSEGADLLIHDAQYTDAEYTGQSGPPRRGWGHSSWESAVEVGRRAEVGRLALFHHDPRREDDGVAQIERDAQGRWAGASRVFAAREGAAIAL